MIPFALRSPSLILILCAALAGCAQNPAISQADGLAARGQTEQGVLLLAQAVRDAPGDATLRSRYVQQRDAVVAELLVQAAASPDAAGLLERVLRLDGSNPRALAGLAALQARQRHAQGVSAARAAMARGDTATAERQLRAVLLESPADPQARQMLSSLREQAASAEAPARSLGALHSRPVTLEFRDTPMKTVFEVLARTSGLNFVFDKDTRTDTRVTIFVRNTAIDDVVKLVLATHQLQRKLLNENTILIYPKTPAKAREYDELVTRSFYLANADVKQAQTMVRTLVKTRDIFIDEKLNLMVIKDTPDAVRMAERLIESLDMAEPEVMLDVEVLEVTRGKLQELGLRFPEQIGYGLLQPTTNTTTVNGSVSQTSTNLGGTLAQGFVDLQNRGGLTAFIPNPALTLNLRSGDGDGRLLANPRIRVKNREKARIHIGDRLPVFTTTSTANVGVAASVSYLDVGLKLEVEPNVFLDDEVGIKVGLEVSSIAREVAGPSSSLAYQIGTRSAATSLRLRNGETQVLAGLISDEERSSTNRLPGLGDLPLIGRLFASQRDNSTKTEIVLLITPRIVRNLSRPAADVLAFPAGSESAVGAPALELRKSEPRSLSMSSSPAAPARAPAAAVSEEQPVVPGGATPEPAPAPALAAVPEAAAAAAAATAATAANPPAGAAPATSPTPTTSPILVSPPGVRP